MKRVHTAKHPTEAHLVKGMLEAEGIRASVLGDQLYGAYGELPVLRDVRWTCAHCGENLEGQFTECWKCGATRPQPA